LQFGIAAAVTAAQSS